MQNFSRLTSRNRPVWRQAYIGDNIKTDPIEVECEVASWVKIRSNRVCYNTEFRENTQFFKLVN